MALTEPVTKKVRKNGGNARFEYGVSAMQGFRQKMEDAHVTVVDLDATSATSFFGVYDGHGGRAVAKFCAKHLHTELRNNEHFNSNLATAVENTFLRMDVMLRDRLAGGELSKYGGNEKWKKYRKAMLFRRFLLCTQRPVYEGPLEDGCTACVALIRDNRIIVGNAGDSRCVISRHGQAIDLSIDHKPNIQAETQRIQNAGRQVTQFQERGNIPRIDNGIAVSRAIGDLRYKDNARLSPLQQAVIAFPDIREEVITDDTEFLVIACDGIWDCMTSQQVVEFIRIHLNTTTLDNICASLLDHCLSLPRGKDNMTAVLVKFRTPAQPAFGQPPQAPLRIQESAVGSGSGSRSGPLTSTTGAATSSSSSGGSPKLQRSKSNN